MDWTPNPDGPTYYNRWKTSHTSIWSYKVRTYSLSPESWHGVGSYLLLLLLYVYRQRTALILLPVGWSAIDAAKHLEICTTFISSSNLCLQAIVMGGLQCWQPTRQPCRSPLPPPPPNGRDGRNDRQGLQQHPGMANQSTVLKLL